MTVNLSGYREETGKSVGEGLGDLAAKHFCLMYKLLLVLVIFA